MRGVKAFLIAVAWCLLTVVSSSSAYFTFLNLVPDYENAPFLHGVASHDPLEDSVLIWTRVSSTNVTEDDDVGNIKWAVWKNGQSFEHPERSGKATTNADVDYTVTIDVKGLASDTSYYYQFQVGNSRSMLGQTKTIHTNTETIHAAIMSCTSLWSGYFNFYRHLASDDNIDFVLHLGDFIYPLIDKDEVYRVPYGQCTDWKDLKAASIVGGTAQDNDDPYLRQLVGSLDCATSTTLNFFRYVQNLYMLDPDLRAARARHPFIVSFDNHDVNDNALSNRLPISGSRQAGQEWVPMRTKIDVDVNGNPFISSLRQFRFGANNLLDLVVMDTFLYSGNLIMKEKNGILGEGQHQWLDAVLKNSSNVQWRVFGSGKQFMPFAANRLPRAIGLPMGLFLAVLVVFVCACVLMEIALLAKQEGGLYATLPQNESGSKPLPRAVAGIIRRAHHQAPRHLRALTLALVLTICLWAMIWAGGALTLKHLLDSSEKLQPLNPALDVWSGHEQDSMTRLFDQLEATGTDSNNFWATGDMHFSFAADVFRFDPEAKESLLGYSQNDEAVKRYGVEMLPASGTRGNIDEMLGGIVPFLKPSSLLSGLSDAITNHMVGFMNPHFQYFQGQAHGYGKLTVTLSQIEASFLQFPILKKTNEFRVGTTMYVPSGVNKWARQSVEG